MKTTYDTIILGAGPGGYELAALLASKGESVALIESLGAEGLGGTCLNRGCIPTKTLCHAAEIADSHLDGASYGIEYPAPTIDWNKLLERKNKVIAQLREGIAMTLNGVDLIHATGAIGTNQSVILSSGETISAPRIVIATGSVASTLPVDGADSALTSDDILNLTQLPESIIIVGGGVIGMEFASIFNSLGVNVTVVEYCKEILPPFDKDIAKRLRSEIATRGVTFALSSQVTSMTQHSVTFLAKGKETTIEAEVVFSAVGRRPNLPEGLDAAGIEYSRKGIVVNPNTFETNVAGIYAIGDVNGLSMLAHAASAQARVIAGESIDTTVIPAAVFTRPEAAMVGFTEEQCKERQLDYESIKIPFRGNGKAVSMDADKGLLKLIVDNATRQLLGLHIVGPHAADMVQSAAIVIANGLSVEAISNAIHIHPTLGELLLTAASRI